MPQQFVEGTKLEKTIKITPLNYLLHLTLADLPLAAIRQPPAIVRVIVVVSVAYFPHAATICELCAFIAQLYWL